VETEMNARRILETVDATLFLGARGRMGVLQLTSDPSSLFECTCSCDV
jgi:hypothetical protein